MRETIGDWVPGAADGIVDARACLYTMTPDEDFVVDSCDLSRLVLSGDDDDDDQNGAAAAALEAGEYTQTRSNVWYAAGLSGHGFEMTPALGEALADLVVTGTTDLPVGFLKIDRLLARRECREEGR